MIAYGEYLPDLSEFDNPGSPKAKNVRPSPDGFSVMRDLLVSTDALNSACRGAYGTVAADGTSYNYAGTGSKLYQLESNSWKDQSKSGDYTLNLQDGWEMEKWNETIIAVGGVNLTNPVRPQVITMAPTASSQFADLAGNPPQAKHIAVVREFVILGNLEEGGTLYPGRVRWSGINDSTFWQSNSRKQADFQDLKGGGGAIQAILGGEYGLIIQEQSIRRMDYTGAKLVFSIDETLPGVGTPAPSSVIQYGNVVAFLGRSGFEIVTEGQVREQIGANKIDKTFYADLDRDNIYRVVGALDRVNEQFVWIYPGEGSSGGTPNKGLIFDIKSNRWAPFEIQTEFIYGARSPAWTLEAVDIPFPNLEDATPSFDDPYWSGGASQLWGFNPSHQSGPFSGSPLTGFAETAEVQLGPGRVFLSQARSETQLSETQTKSTAGTITLQVRARDNLSDSGIWTDSSARSRKGFEGARAKGQFFKFRTNFNEIAFNRARGVSVVKMRKGAGP